MEHPPSPEKEEPSVALCWISRLLRFCIDVIEHSLTYCGMVVQIVADLNCPVRVDMAVPGQPEIPEHIPVHVPVLHGEDQTAVITEDWIFRDLTDWSGPVISVLRRQYGSK